MSENTSLKNNMIYKKIAIIAGVIIAIILFIWIPFKVVPKLFSNGSSFIATTLSSTFIPNENTATTTKVTEVTEVTKEKETETKLKALPTPSTNNANSQQVYTTQTYYTGKPDLAIRFIAVGIIDPGSKQFFPTNYAGQNDTIGIKFEVKNVGSNVTGPWKLRLNMPSRTTPYYDSDYQVSIRPGDRMEFTATFDNVIAQGINMAYITADPLNMVSEILENNNSLTVPISVQGTTYSYNNNYSYNNSTSGSAPYGTLYTWTNLNANCYANPQNSYPGSMVTWYATASGGNGYFTYSWTGSDGLVSNDMSVNKTYFSSGNKIANVTVTSNGQSVTKTCSMYVL
jgi:hypothetical protein